jgi:hypothetical protein
VDVHKLAQNTGTSTAMTDMFDLKFLPTSSINMLTPDWLGSGQSDDAENLAVNHLREVSPLPRGG